MLTIIDKWLLETNIHNPVQILPYNYVWLEQFGAKIMNVDISLISTQVNCETITKRILSIFSL